MDFDGVELAATRDPKNPRRLLPAYDSGDHLHPNATGYRAMAEAVDLTLFGQTVAAQRMSDTGGVPFTLPLAALLLGVFGLGLAIRRLCR